MAKPSYKLAHDARKGDSSMQIEGVIDKTEPTLRDGAIPSPDKPGAPKMSISPNPKAGSGWRESTKTVPAKPSDEPSTPDPAKLTKT